MEGLLVTEGAGGVPPETLAKRRNRRRHPREIPQRCVKIRSYLVRVRPFSSNCSVRGPEARGIRLAQSIVMSHIITRRRVLGVFEHMLAIVVGFTLMVLGLGLSVTMIMLPIGLVVGLCGLTLFIAGTCVRFDWI